MLDVVKDRLVKVLISYSQLVLGTLHSVEQLFPCPVQIPSAEEVLILWASSISQKLRLHLVQ